IEELPRRADEWQTLRVLIRSRRFAEEADLDARLSVAEDGLRARRAKLAAARAGLYLFGKRLQGEPTLFERQAAAGFGEAFLGDVKDRRPRFGLRRFLLRRGWRRHVKRRPRRQPFEAGAAQLPQLGQQVLPQRVEIELI